MSDVLKEVDFDVLVEEDGHGDEVGVVWEGLDQSG